MIVFQSPFGFSGLDAFSKLEILRSFRPETPVELRYAKKRIILPNALLGGAEAMGELSVVMIYRSNGGGDRGAQEGTRRWCKLEGWDARLLSRASSVIIVIR